MEYRAEKATASLHGKASLLKVKFRRVLTPDWLLGGRGLKVGNPVALRTSNLQQLITRLSLSALSVREKFHS